MQSHISIVCWMRLVITQSHELIRQIHVDVNIITASIVTVDGIQVKKEREAAELKRQREEKKEQERLAKQREKEEKQRLKEEQQAKKQAEIE